MNLTTTRKKRLAGVAALAFSGAVILGACDGEGEFPLCNTLDGALQDLSIQIGDVESQLSALEESGQGDSIQADLLEVELAALDEAYDFKLQQYEANCESTDFQTVLAG